MGGAISVDEKSSVSFSGTTVFTGNSAVGGNGGALFVNYSTLLWDDGSANAVLAMNFASGDGGAIAAQSSHVSWKGYGESTFSGNSADDEYGGAIHARGSIVSWNRDGTHFNNNWAYDGGGAVYAYESSFSWDGDGTNFSYTTAVVTTTLDLGARSTHNLRTCPGMAMVQNSCVQLGV